MDSDNLKDWDSLSKLIDDFQEKIEKDQVIFLMANVDSMRKIVGLIPGSNIIDSVDAAPIHSAAYFRAKTDKGTEFRFQTVPDNVAPLNDIYLIPIRKRFEVLLKHED